MGLVEFLNESSSFSLVGKVLGFNNPSTINNYGNFLIVKGFKTYIAITSKNIFKTMQDDSELSGLYSNGTKNIINFIKIKRESSSIKQHNDLYIHEKKKILSTFGKLKEALDKKNAFLIKNSFLNRSFILAIKELNIMP